MAEYKVDVYIGSDKQYVHGGSRKNIVDHIIESIREYTNKYNNPILLFHVFKKSKSGWNPNTSIICKQDVNDGIYKMATFNIVNNTSSMVYISNIYISNKNKGENYNG